MRVRHAVLLACVVTLVPKTVQAGDGVGFRLQPVPISQVSIEDGFWSPKLQVWREATIADAWSKFEHDGALRNFDLIRDGKGDYAGPPFFDGLVYETIRGCADFLAARRDPALEAQLDGYIERIAAAAARDPDGYLNTWTTIKQPQQRWGTNGGDDYQQHDVYNAGALVEAGVHYYQATGKTALLKVAVRMANHMCDVMGQPPKRNVIPGHSLAEEAVAGLYLLFQEHPELKAEMPVPVEERRYLELAESWIDLRGHAEGRRCFGYLGQDHMPVLEQTTIEGHAVRATLMCAGLVALAGADRRDDYAQAANRLWDNFVQRRMYITGGAGAIADGEKFGRDYQLPNNGYLETCAAIGGAFFHRNLNLLRGDARSADELERALYNGVLCGVSVDGKRYFYMNPLESGADRVRWAWHGCPCCPPMFLKIMGALPSYVYATDAQGIYVNLYLGSRVQTTLGDCKVTLKQTTNYPWQGTVQLAVEPEKAAEFTVNLRIPGWCEGATIRVNGKAVEPKKAASGYVPLRRQWMRGDVVELDMPMPVRRMHADPRVEADRGRVALMRGPLVYCVEDLDCSAPLEALVVSADAKVTAEVRPELLGGMTVLCGTAKYPMPKDKAPDLYSTAGSETSWQEASWVAIPYYANANREPAAMRVWLAEEPSQAVSLGSPTLTSWARPSASFRCPTDPLAGLNDGRDPAHSADESVPRFTWWDHRGTAEWVQYDFREPTTVSATEVYWWDERKVNRHCRVPQSWRLLYRDGDQWRPVPNASAYGAEPDCYNRVTFDAVKTTALRLEVQLQKDWSGGILEWKLDGPTN